MHGTIKDRRDAPMRFIMIGAFTVLFIVAFVVVIIGGVLITNAQDTAEKAQASARQSEQAIAKLYTQDIRIDSVAEGQCERVQLERERSNVLEATVYLVLKTASVASPSPMARKAYKEQAEATAYAPPTNCDRAVADPRGYRPPPRIPFTVLGADFANRIIQAAHNGHREPPFHK